MGRNRLSLDGTWDFQFVEGVPEQPADKWTTIEVPYVWQAQFEHLREAAGTGWYRKTLPIPDEWQNQSIVLHIGAAYHITDVWVNDQHVAKHSDGYLPLEVDLQAFLRYGETNTILIRVVSPSDDKSLYPDIQFSQIPHGKQSWYGHLGGIWQSVWIECRPALHIDHVTVQAQPDTGEVQCTVQINQPSLESYRVRAAVDDVTDSVDTDDTHTRITLTVQQPKLWSPDAPHLYTMRIDLLSTDGTVVDTLHKTLGFRKIETRDGKIYLNGQPFYLRGALDQDYYPHTITTPPSPEFIEDQMHKAKAMGLNCLRYHIKLADPRYYDAADRIGVLLWVDYPNWQQLSDYTKEHIKQSLEAMLRRDHHHPSIGIWTIVNEDWGTDLVGNPEHRQWLKDMYHWLKAKDDTRLVVDNSPNEPNFHVQTDINDYHYYSAIPDSLELWDAFVGKFASGAFQTHSPHGDAKITGEEPRIISEFGNWGLPNIDGLLDENGNEPWWFETGDEWPEGVVYPHGVKNRFRRWHLDRVFGSWEVFIEQVQWQQFRALAHEIDTMRLYKEIDGYVITEFTDVHWEPNGLLDMNRQPKAYFDSLKHINGNTTLIPQIDRTAVWSGEQIDLKIAISHVHPEPIDYSTLVVLYGEQTIATKQMPIIATSQPFVVPLTMIASEVTQPTDVVYELALLDKHGEPIAYRELCLAVFPRRVSNNIIWTPSDRLAAWLESLDYSIVTTASDSTVIVANQLTPELTQMVQEGCRLLLLAEGTDAIPSESSDPLVIEPYFPYARIVKRQHTAWEGNWASTVAWVDAPELSAEGTLLDSRFRNIIPTHIITGFKQGDFLQDVYAGLFAGWIHKPVALAGMRYYGEGRTLISTFNLTSEKAVGDPMTQHMLDHHIKHLCE